MDSKADQNYAMEYFFQASCKFVQNIAFKRRQYVGKLSIEMYRKLKVFYLQRAQLKSSVTRNVIVLE